MSFVETAHTFGPQKILFGILSKPAQVHPKARDLCVVFFNAGLLHRVGPYRTYVEWARELAEMGITSFRFDLSGLGESDSRDSTLPEMERAVLDTKDAFDFLGREFGLKRMVSIGLCSGADQAHDVGVADARLVGAVMMDGPGYPNAQYKLKHYASKVTRLQSWKTAAKLATQKLTSSSVSEVGGDREETFERVFRPQEQIQDEIVAMAQRGTELLYLYTGGVFYYFNHASQFDENFPKAKANVPGSRVELEYYEGSGHTYTDPRDRKVMKERVNRWLKQKFLG